MIERPDENMPHDIHLWSNIENAGKGDPKSCYQGIVNAKELYIPKSYYVIK